MLNTDAYVLLAGNPSKWDEETLKRVKRHGKLLDSDSLVTVQADQHRRGRRSAVLTQSVYGWSVRNASGLSNFDILAGPKRGAKLSGSIEEAIAWGCTWANDDRDNREFYAFKADLSTANIDPSHLW